MANFDILAAILKKNAIMRQLMENNSNLNYPVFFLFKTMIKYRIFHVLFYCEQIRLKYIINCIYPSWLNF